jgi:predicted small metal-binding protein
MPTFKCLSCDLQVTTLTGTALVKTLTEHAMVAHNIQFLPAIVINNLREAVKVSEVVTCSEIASLTRSGSAVTTKANVLARQRVGTVVEEARHA